MFTFAKKFLFQEISMQRNAQKKKINRQKNNYDLGVGPDEK